MYFPILDGNALSQTLASGATIVCTANDTDSICDLVKVTGDLVTEGAVTVDLGRDALNPLAKTFAAKVAEIDGTVTPGGPLDGTGCGIPGSVVVVRREGGEIWARVISGGAMLIIRRNADDGRAAPRKPFCRANVSAAPRGGDIDTGNISSPLIPVLWYNLSVFWDQKEILYDFAERIYRHVQSVSCESA